MLYEIYIFQSKKEHNNGRSANDGINEAINKKVEQKRDGSWKINAPFSDLLDKKVSVSADELNDNGQWEKKQHEITVESTLLLRKTEIISGVMERNEVEKNRSKEEMAIEDAPPPLLRLEANTPAIHFRTK